MTSAPHASSSAFVAARQASQVIERILDAVSGETRVVLSSACSELGRLSPSDPASSLGSLEHAMRGLSNALESCRKDPTGSSRQAAHVLARTMAVLHPARIELQRIVAAAGMGGELPAVQPRSSVLPSGHEDRRSSPRVVLEADIGFMSETNFYTGFSGDISEGGLFVATYNLLPVGTELLVSFVLPGGHHVTTQGRVCWVRESEVLDSEMQPGMGIEFAALKPDDTSAITAFTNRRSPLFYDGD